MPRQGPRLTLGSPKASGLGNLTSCAQPLVVHKVPLQKPKLPPAPVLFEKTAAKVQIEVMRLSPSLDLGL